MRRNWTTFFSLSLGIIISVQHGLNRHEAHGFDNIRVSVSSDGIQGNDLSGNPSISADGRYVVFVSRASNLVQNDNNGFPDIFLHDIQTGITSLVSVNSKGEQANEHSSQSSISADGRLIVFRSMAINLIENDINRGDDIFLHDTQTSVTRIINVNSDGEQADGSTSESTISADGRIVAFQSNSTNLVKGKIDGKYGIYIHNIQTGITSLVSVNSDGEQGNDVSEMPSISADGRYVAFHSYASNLAQGDINGNRDVFVHDTQTSITSLVSVDSNGKQGNGESGLSSISSDGRFVSFQSNSDNLVQGDTNAIEDIFVHDTQTGITKLVSVDSNGRQGNGISALSSISTDGNYVAFISCNNTLLGGNNLCNVFKHNVHTGDTIKIGVGDTGDSMISNNGKYIVFVSGSDNLVPNDTNGVRDIFVYGNFDTTSPEMSNTPTHTPTFTPVHTNTPTHTNTIIPTFTPIPLPSNTPTPAIPPTTIPTPFISALCTNNFTLQHISTLQLSGTPIDFLTNDMNSDGYQDIVLAIPDQKKISVYLATSGLMQPLEEMVIPVEHETEFIASGDFDGDGYQDIASLSYFDESLFILFGDQNDSVRKNIKIDIPSTFHTIPTLRTNGRLQPIVSAISANGMKDEIYLLEYGNSVWLSKVSRLQIDDEQSNISKQSIDIDLPSNQNFQALNLSDINQDGKPELSLLTMTNPSIVFLQQDSDTSFKPIHTFSLETTIAGNVGTGYTNSDADSDSIPDMVIIPFDGTIRMFNTNQLRFQETFVGDIGQMAIHDDVIVSDFDNDGQKDMLVVSRQKSGGDSFQQLSVICGEDIGSFKNSITFVTNRIANPFSKLRLGSIDFNRDELKDVVYVDDSTNELILFANLSSTNVGDWFIRN